MNRIRQWASTPSPEYEPIEHPADANNEDQQSISSQNQPVPGFSRFEYGVFLLLGVSMLWAWNMFLAAAPYFHRRFESNDWAATHYQSSILTVSTITNLGSVFILARLQKGASYPKRINISILINIAVFTLLAFSTVIAKHVSVSTYFGFLLVMVFGASLATGINQNGVFAYVSGFGREEYTQAIMAGQGVAGVLPCIVQILSVLAVPEKKGDDQPEIPQESSKSAFFYFITSAAVSFSALVAFLALAKRRSHHYPAPDLFADQADDCTSDHSPSKTISLWVLFKKLRLMALAVFLCFAITMIFPVFTAEIESVHDPSDRSRMFEPPVFVPLAFFFWNVGDLIGRISVIIPQLSLAHRPLALFLLAIGRVVFIPLYLVCNIRGRGAAVESDFFYLFIVQLLFGVSNGYLGSSCMMGAGHWVSEDEREPTGGFMGLMLVGGLTAGSLLSFFVSSA
ncbi:hypothetical protein EYZ11_007657 [Aspergillus tanneri]|uniref:Nucleoside transporter n=1 Tax=Aspergillus tanneri TaxID=1220188 RepID=A0A4S3JCG6_9EURO|nr:uncharacterized protein ATNIH1004_004739 [Aspergillus tanneri]KAA8648853.1 hypothetical protein ATNIH1004_004739 [Aspergillus tanneri]THC92876.1 hypothetical protein EYZ11_007657 [Aspergillus tanneri]